MLSKSITLVLSLCATLAAAQGPLIDDKLSTALIRYAWFSSAAYSANCQIPPFNSTIEARFQDFLTDHQATLFRDDAAQEYILAFRGTNSPMDIWTDFRKSLANCSSELGPACVNCFCHKGFLKQYQGIDSKVTPHLTKQLNETGYSLTVTGHSMGAAGASIYATVLRSKGIDLNAYTYGQPRTGNKAFADYVDSMFPPYTGPKETNNMFRATNRNDGVPQVPWHKKGRYHHHSTEIWTPMSGGEAVICAGQEPKKCNSWHSGYPLNAAHFSYFGVSTGDPVNRNAGCRGGQSTPELANTELDG